MDVTLHSFPFPVKSGKQNVPHMRITDDKDLVKRIFKILAEEYVVLITGESGSGKGTLVESFKGVNLYDTQVKCLVTTGDEFRKKKETASPDVCKILQATNDAGERQNGFVAAALVCMEVMDYFDKKGITIVEGSPRSPEEADYLYKFFWGFLRRKIVVINVYAPEELAIKRIMERNEKDRLANRPVRTDTDTPEKIRAKLAYYKRDVIPAFERMEDYPVENVVTIKVSVMTEEVPPEDVFEEVLGRLAVIVPRV